MRRLLTGIALCLTLLPAARADFGNYVDHAIVGTTLVVQTDIGELRITPLDESAFEIHYAEDGLVQLPSFALRGNPPGIPTAFEETEGSIIVRIAGLTASVSKSPVRIEYLRDDNALLSEDEGYFRNDTMRGFRFRLGPGEKILGGGERVLGMDRRGQRMPLYNKAAYEYTTHTDQMYYSLSAVLSSDRYMIVFDNSASGWLDIGKSDPDVLAFEAVSGRTAYLVIAGDDYPAVIRNLTDVTGTQPLPPRWAFGNFASRFGYHSEQEARDVVQRFRDADMPLDAVILDLYWYGPDIKGHVGNLDWYRPAFPTPEDMIADFAADGVRTIAVTQPFVLSTSNNWQEAVDNDVLAKNDNGEPYRFDFYFGNTGLIDVFDANARQWFWQAYDRLFDQGIAATWGDLGEPEVHPDDIQHWLSDYAIQARGDAVHNAFGHVWAKMVYENQVANFPDMRPLLLMRSGFVGSQRYALVPWTGDVSRSWGGLKPQVELSLQMGLFGLAYTHSDLGGFAEGKEFDKELYIRWLQYGTFQPVYRPHGQEHIASEPVFHDRETRDIVRDYIDLRYRLLPYNYTLAWENSTTGMPLMRPLFFEDEADTSLIDNDDAYLWGNAFLVAPVTDPGADSIAIDLPAGAWFDFWDDTRYAGSQTVNVPVTLETIPVLVRAGSFVPMVDVVQTTRDYSSEHLTLHYYADESVKHSTGTMYEDDGSSRLSLEFGQFELLRFDAERDGDSLVVELRRDGGSYDGMPGTRELDIVIHNWSADVEELRFGNQTIPLSRRDPKSGPGAWHDRKNNRLVIRADWDHSPVRLVVNPQTGKTGKAVVYQVFTRLFGNQQTANVPWGTIEENGVGKFSDVTDAALDGIRELGTTHIWYTGVPHHALVTDYTEYGISNDDPDVVKGRAGSPYSVKDYYNVNPDLADDPANRLAEFEALIERTHAHGMQVIIDIVPNHVARGYHSVSNPPGVEDFGASDDTSVAWAKDNNFYYVVGEDFVVPEPPEGFVPLGGEPNPLADGEFDESPARWTANDVRTAQPLFSDWFEAVKINHGVRPDGSFAFDRLPEEARNWTVAEHLQFWSDKDIPDSWTKFRDITLYWIGKGVDGFRYDMAEMVPVEFWSYLNASIRTANPDAFLLAEIYNPDNYRNYVELGLIDYLYDKVGLYDTLKLVVQGAASTDAIVGTQAGLLDIEEHMLHFLENHDEERIASSNFAGDADRGRPAMVVSALIGSSPTMLYFGQEVGAQGAGNPDYDEPMRTSLFDYAGVPAHQRWMNGGAFDGALLSTDERELRDYYVRLLNYSATDPVMLGAYAEIHDWNRAHTAGYDDRLFSFVRWNDDEQRIVVSNFDAARSYDITMAVPVDIVRAWSLTDGRYALADALYGTNNSELVIDGGTGLFRLQLEPLESVVFEIGDGLFTHALDAAYYMDTWQHAGIQGTLLYWKDVHSRFLDEDRNVTIWLPEGYDDDPERRYPVIYMHDGQNLFDPRIANTGIDWGVDEAMTAGVREGRFEPAIVVGVWSSPQRFTEYSPWHAAPQYARFLIEELMPRVNAGFRTLQGPENTFAAGASMGGLLSFYLVKDHPEVFGACGCLSTPFLLSDAYGATGPDAATADATPYIVRDIEQGAPLPPGARFFFDFGTGTLDAGYAPSHAIVRDWLLGEGLVEGEDFRIEVYAGANHSEAAWRARLIDQLEWMLGGR